MGEKLKPCPFCGGEARIIAKPYEPKVCVGCDDDTCLGFSGLGWLYDSEKEATEAWNSRAERTCHLIHEVEEEDDEFFDTVELHSYVCSECGSANRMDARYCDWCGACVIEEES